MGQADDFMWEKRSGESLAKRPGTLKGEGFLMMNLTECKAYVLDYTQQVQVDLCSDCTLVIGPVDGSVFFRDCKNCTIYVACRQLRTRDCENCTISLYCATDPIIETSKDITFSCWMGAYPGLSEQFVAANLDPLANNWRKVYNFNQEEENAEGHFTVLDDAALTGVPWLEVTDPEDGFGPLEGTPENPVPAADGRVYAASAGVAASAGFVPAPSTPAETDAFFAEAPAPVPAEEDPFGAPAPAPSEEDPFFAAPAPAPAPAPAEEDPFFAAPAPAPAPASVEEDPFFAAPAPAPAPAPAAPMDDFFAAPAPAPATQPSATVSGTGEKAAREVQVKAEWRAEGEAFLEQFYAERRARIAATAKSLRENEAAITGPSAAGAGDPFSAALALIDTGAAIKERMKQVLIRKAHK
mmetsp:Transcript_18560/g.60486  ORF Transcript_18560/g.60486 Transcript_18560/m.60486 type:complete len:411 (-) Transcript_18560:1778-3010(-)